MKQTILLIIVILASFVYAEKQDVFQLTLDYDKEEISKNSLLVIKGYFSKPVQTIDDDYTLKMISYKNKVLYEQKFSFPLEIFGAPPAEWFDEQGRQIHIPTAEESGHIILDKASVELILPYFENAEKINIYKDDNLKLSIGVSHFTKQEKVISEFLYLFLLILIIVVIYVLKVEKKEKNKLKRRKKGIKNE